MPKWFSDMWVPELLIPPKIIRMFGPKTTIFAPKYAFLGTYRPCYLFGWLVGGCGARALSHKTPIFFIYDCLGMFMKLQVPWVLGAYSTDWLSNWQGASVCFTRNSVPCVSGRILNTVPQCNVIGLLVNWKRLSIRLTTAIELRF